MTTRTHDTDSGPFRPDIVLLYCHRSTRECADVNAASEAAAGCVVRPTLMPCSGKAEASHLLKLLEHGADGVEVVACPERKCRFLDGNVRAEKRIERVRHLLDQIRMGADRVGLSRGEGLSARDLVDRAAERARIVMPLGPNPMKRQKGGPG
jgi:F420-non-reducing hydrogenase iron-sulfur subunit